jgi:hypothetical protein
MNSPQGEPASHWSFPLQEGKLVQAAFAQGMINIRNFRNPGGAVLHYSPGDWPAFLQPVKQGRYDIHN